MITDGYGALVLFAAGWLACLLWTHRIEVGDWIEEWLDAVLSDPEPRPPARMAPPRSHVRSLRQWDDEPEERA